MYAEHQPLIQAYGLESPEHTYKVLEFVIATVNRHFATVPYVLATRHRLTGSQHRALEFLYLGRGMVYEAIQETRHNPVDLMTYLVSLPALGVAKAGFAAQLLSGQVGCMDTWNRKAFNIPKNMLRIDSKTNAQSVFIKLFQYCDLCAKLGSAFLWDQWCATVAAQYKPLSAFYPWQTAEQVSLFHLECLKLA